MQSNPGTRGYYMCSLFKVHNNMGDDPDLPDKPREKYFKCHLGTRFNFIVGIVCEEVYHLKEFKRQKKAKTVSEIFAICNSHPNLTSNAQEIDLSSETRLLIAEIRQNEIIRAQQKRYQEVEQNLSISINSNKTLNDADPVVRSIITENILLRQLNEELKCKSDLLLNTIELMKIKKPTYAETTKNRNTKHVRIPDINVIKKSEGLSNKWAVNNINKVLQNDTIIPINRIINTKNS